MSSPKKIGRWNRFEIAFNEGKWPKPSFSSPEKKRSLGKMAKETPDVEEFAKEIPVENAAFEEETSPESSGKEKKSLPNTAAPPTLWAETAKKRRP